MMDLVQGMEKDIEIAKSAISEIGKRGKEYAIAYTNYRVQLRKKMLQLKDEGNPATLVSDLARGDDLVALAKQEELIKEAEYKACLEAINVYKLSANVQKTQYEKEFSNCE